MPVPTPTPASPTAMTVTTFPAAGGTSQIVDPTIAPSPGVVGIQAIPPSPGNVGVPGIPPPAGTTGFIPS